MKSNHKIHDHPEFFKKIELRSPSLQLIKYHPETIKKHCSLLPVNKLTQSP